MANITESNYKVYLGKIATHAKAYCTIATYPNSSSQLPSVEALYGIYDSKSTAHITLCNWFGDISDATSNTPCTAIPRGFTVAIEENNTVVEYQYKKPMPSGGYTSSDLEVKGVASISASDVSYGSSNVGTALTNAESDIQQLRSDIGTMSSLETTSNRNLVGAVNEVNTKANDATTSANNANTKIGDLTSLQTTNKTSVVNAINEVKGAIPTSMSAENVTYDSSGNHTVGSIAEAVATAEESIQTLDSSVYYLREDVDNLMNNVGDISDLDTPAQDLVSAINSGITTASNSATAASASSAAAQQASTSAMNAAQSVLDELDNFPASQDATVLQHGTRITALESTSVHDLSVMYSSSYVDLSAALTALNADASATAIKVAGMSIKFLNSTTNKYEQWNLKASSWSTNTSDWGNINITDASEVKYGNGNVKDALDNAVSKTDSISKEATQSEEDAIIFETDGGTQVGKIDSTGADFTNLTRGGQQVARMSDLPEKDSSIGDNPSNSHVPTTKAVKEYVDEHALDYPIEKETAQSLNEEYRFTDDTETHTYAKVNENGVSSKGYYDMEGKSVLSGLTLYIATNGSDTNDGTSAHPLATINKALVLGARTVIINGGVYENQQIDLSKLCGDTISIRPINEKVKVILKATTNTTVATSASAHGTYDRVKTATYAGTPLPYLYQLGIADAATLISDAERMPQQRGKTYRCEDMTLIKVCTSNTLNDALEEIQNADDYRYYKDGNTLYFSSPEAVSSNNPIIRPLSKDLFVNATRNHTIYMNGIETWMYRININNTTNSIIADCASKYVYGGGCFTWDNCLNATFIRCEAARAVYITTTGDGFNAHSTTEGDAFAYHTTARLINCWSHDNCDDGYSDHERCECMIIGGLFEYNGKAGVTPSYGSHCECHDVYSRKNYTGFLLTGQASDGGKYSQCTLYNCIAESNDRGGNKIGFAVKNGAGNRMILYNCIAINEVTGFSTDSNTILDLYDCRQKDCTTPVYGSANKINTSILN